MEKKNFYVTTSIAYTNAPPHIGYALELIQADVLARYHRTLGENVFFLTGTDEHGIKIQRRAEEENKKPGDFTDEISESFRQLAKILNISNDDFIRTTDARKHWPVVKEVWQKLENNGDLEKRKYKGYYCVGCEAFVKEKDLIDGKCPIHQKIPEVVEEENWFFKLSKYSEEIKKIIANGQVNVVPEVRKNEMLAFLEHGLEDISFSRPKEKLSWGIPVPEDDSQTIYVWADALVNYISALGYPEGEKFKKFWPAQIHCVGKDILRFHAIIWIGMLLSLDLSLPENIFVHGFITSGGKKMSKSLGNVADPFELVEKYGSASSPQAGTDALRYYLLREIPSAEDGDYTEEKFKERYNADLAGGIGNLVARVITLARKFEIKNSNPQIGSKFKIQIDETKDNCRKYLDEFKFNEALAVIWGLISFCDKYINDEKPWSLNINDDKKKIEEVLGNLLVSIREVARLILPFLPKTSEKMIEQFDEEKNQPLFPRV